MDTIGGFAQFVLVEAQVKLLEEALKDALNEKFVMLSETAIPIHRPEIVYLQLIHESKSRINACKGNPARMNPERWMGKCVTHWHERFHSNVSVDLRRHYY